MSIRLMSQVWEDARIQSQAELLVLLALADHARDDGLCWPSIRTIAAKARIEERSAQRILRRLIEKGLVELVSQGGCIEGHNVPNRYRVKGGDAASPHGLTESHPGATLGLGVAGDRQSPRGDSENRDGVTLGQGNHHIEPSLSKTTTTTCSELDNQYRDEASEASSSSRRFFGSAQPRPNAARALMAALRDDWQPPVATKGQSNATHKASVRAGNRNIGNSNQYCDLSQYKSRN